MSRWCKNQVETGIDKIHYHRGTSVSVCEQTNAATHKDTLRYLINSAYNNKKKTLQSLPLSSSSLLGEGTRAPGDKWDFGTTEMPSAPENTSCWKSFPSPEERESMTDLYTCKSADLSFLHGWLHRVTSTMATSHYRDPRSTGMSSHYCTMRQNVYINVV